MYIPGFYGSMPQSRAQSLSSSSPHFMYFIVLVNILPWLVWLSGLSAGLQTKGLPVRFPVGAHTWVAGQVPSRGCVRGNHILMFLSLSFSLPFPLSKKRFFLLLVTNSSNWLKQKKQFIGCIIERFGGYLNSSIVWSRVYKDGYQESVSLCVGLFLS